MKPLFVRALFLLAITFPASPAAAQDARARKWEVEAHGGGMLASHPTRGSVTMPDPAATFTTLAGRPSRRVSSWYFGDGPPLLNDVSSALLASQRITSLDPALNTSIARRSSGGAFGVRVSRAINARFTVEAAFDYSLGRLALTDTALAAIESSRGTFASAWNGLIRTGPFVQPTVSSVATIDSSRGTQIFTTGALNIALKTRGKAIPYVTVGAGVVSTRGGTPRASLAGNYQFMIMFGSFAPAAPINESDSVTVRALTADTVFVGVVGGGVKYYVSPRWGVRADVRGHLGANKTTTVVDATPSVATGSPLGLIASSTNPSIQFSNSATSPQRSSLSGPAISQVRTFAGRGAQSHVSLTTGVFWRF